MFRLLIFVGGLYPACGGLLLHVAVAFDVGLFRVGSVEYSGAGDSIARTRGLRRARPAEERVLYSGALRYIRYR